MKILYTDCDIPARLYYQMMYTGDYSKMGEGTPEQLEDAFNIIVDEHFTLYPNESAIEWFKKRAKTDVLKLQIYFLECKAVDIYNNRFNPELVAELADEMNSLDKVKVKFDVKKDLLDEIERVQNKVIGFLKNLLHITEGVKKEESEKQAFNFFEELSIISLNLMMPLSADISLHQYESYKKLAKERSNANKTTANG